MASDFDLLIKKLNAFIKKYYYNKLLRGVIVSLTGILFLFLFVDFIEYFAWMGKGARQFVFITFLVITFIVLVFQVLVPLFKLLNLGKTLTYEEAARIIGKHFPDVDDKLLNVLQLKFKENTFSREEIELLSASISQKSRVLKPVPFTGAVNLRENLKYLKYFLPPFLIMLSFLVIYPSFIIEPSKRIVNYEEHFSKPLPYSVELLNDTLMVLQHEDFVVRVSLSGDEIPSEVFIIGNGLKYRMYPLKKDVYEYVFKDVNKDIKFNIATEDYLSGEYHLKVLPKPVIYSFDVNLVYPDYLHKKSEKISGLGDLVVPEGTEIEWRIHTKDVSRIGFFIKDKVLPAQKINENTFLKKIRATGNFRYGLIASNDLVKSPDTMFYTVQVVKDEYPSVEVREYYSKDFIGFVQFNGKIRDDYGFHSLKLFYKKEEEGSKWNIIALDIDKNITEEYFNYSMQLLDQGFKPGDGLNYYFEVRDNDALHGYKKARSNIGYIHLPDQQELEQMIDSSSDQLKDDLKNKIRELEDINRKLDEIKMETFEKKMLNWSDRKKIEDLINKEQALQNKVDELNKLNEEIRNLQEALKKKMDPQLQEKLEQLQEMFEKMKDENLEKELEKLKKELSEMNKDKLNEFLDQMKKKNEDLKNNLEQNLELYKQFEVEQKFDETVQKLKELGDKQEKLAQQTKEKKLSAEESLEKQKELEEEFKDVQKQIDEVRKLDQELKEPFNIEKDTAAVKDINQEIQGAKEELEKSKEKKASEKQKNAGEKMKKMAEDMENMMSMAMMERAGEDMDMIRRLLDNLVDLSFRQEKLIREIGKLSTKDPKFVTSTEDLQDLKDEFKVIKDSLRAIGQRQIAIKPFVIRETENIESDLSSAIRKMADRKKGESMSRQQYAMMHMNNLALMLEESLDQMKSSMSMGGKGSQSCPNPGKGNSQSLDDIMKGQKQLAKKMKEQGKKKGGKKKGGKEKGQGQKNGEWGDSEELARMAAIQYELRMLLQKYLDELKGQGLNSKELTEALKEMQKTEEDIINRKITQETIRRQKDIEVRLLKAKNAKMQREKENKREAREGKNSGKRKVDDIKFDLETINKDDIIFTKPLELKYYYNKIYKKYMYRIND
jgi:hypothetical protein